MVEILQFHKRGQSHGKESRCSNAITWIEHSQALGAKPLKPPCHSAHTRATASHHHLPFITEGEGAPGHLSPALATAGALFHTRRENMVLTPYLSM